MITTILTILTILILLVLIFIFINVQQIISKQFSQDKLLKDQITACTTQVVQEQVTDSDFESSATPPPAPAPAPPPATQQTPTQQTPTTTTPPTTTTTTQQTPTTTTPQTQQAPTQQAPTQQAPTTTTTTQQTPTPGQTNQLSSVSTEQLLTTYATQNIEGFENSDLNTNLLPSNTVLELYSLLINMSPDIQNKIECSTAVSNKQDMLNVVNCLMGQFYGLMGSGLLDGGDKQTNFILTLFWLKYMLEDNLENVTDIMIYDPDTSRITIISNNFRENFSNLLSLFDHLQYINLNNSITPEELRAIFKATSFQISDGNVESKQCSCLNTS